ncbi:hypothetical protein LHJ74_05015 [Streptomyces sp. N2-109]|uniref:SRPBCC family protein n=1 Tax=Streptomyces gossypii TaxID=2883101 RepID=A0ABT2JPT9_9ACTN|nr:hypothetical protein [Streptomyces gossypii]MCT2589299.1 hypothetical protein [Streptomyces gossypii]
MTTDWPTADLDPVLRLRVMAAGLNSVMYADEYIDAPLADVWSMASDLEGELPHLVPTLSAFHVPPGPEERKQVWAYSLFRHRARFEVLLQPGWCLMQSKYVVGGMAAVAEGSGTRFAVLGGLRQTRLTSLLTPLRPLGRSRGLRMIARARRRTALRRTAPHAET